MPWCTNLVLVFFFLRLKMSSSFSPLTTILNKNKLNGLNYIDWRRNLDTVLIVDRHKFIVTQPCTNFSAIDAF
jgi:hypothetical protein